jgi:hypothetical protein
MCHSPEHLVLIAGALSSLTLLSPTTLPYDRGGVAPSRSVCDAPAPALPPSIAIEPGLASVVRTTLEHSPTFRQQCRILEASPTITATVRVSTRTPGETERALSMMRRKPSGGIDATIEIRSGEELTELLGHELEHVIEQLDGVNLPQLELEGQARRLPGGAFETRRAIAAGRRVSSEVLDRSPDRTRRVMGRVWRAVTALR